jgi:hypothetical protein
MSTPSDTTSARYEFCPLPDNSDDDPDFACPACGASVNNLGACALPPPPRSSLLDFVLVDKRTNEIVARQQAYP